MPRKAGVPNKNFPVLPLEKAIELSQVIQHSASGMMTDRLTLSELLNRSPQSSGFTGLVLASRAYGLTTGGKNADEFGLTATGQLATSDDQAERTDGYRKAVMNVEPFRLFLTAYNRKRVPLPAAFKAFLTGQASVHTEHAEQCMTQLLADAELAGLLRTVKGAKYVDLASPQPAATVLAPVAPGAEDEILDDAEDEDNVLDEQPAPPPPSVPPAKPGRPAAIFLGHGRNRKPVDQLTKILDEYKIPHKVAVDSANTGRPISQKVADVMDECGAAILVFTADQEFRTTNGDTVWRPSENVVYELGAAAVKYGSRIIIFKESGVDFPTNFRDIGHIEFEKDRLDAKGMDLFRELIAFGLVAFSVPAA